VLDGIDEAANDTLVEAAALQLCETLGDDGLVCRLGMARLGVLLASDGPSPPEATAGTLLTALVGPLPGAARLPRTPRLALSRWNPDTSTAAALYTAAANALHAAEVAAMERALASAARIA